MSIIGKTLGHYKIGDQPLGRGGMGEVYRAKDLKLGRDVAIKVLPEEFARDADRVARFQREAKLLASLNHPNIAAIYGLEESGGIQFLVLELVEGETLADQLKRGPIPVEESLKLALQIAEALEAAHEKGVIHRDLKPANIKVTLDGKVKVLDFGLAKAFAGEQTDINSSNSPTLSNAATQQGVILGTAAYMSPEQAKGKTVDKRADVWAFGCVLFEMLTGQAAFQGEDITEILAAVVKGGANLDLLPANLHSRVREVITRCLQKDLKRRYSSITDARYEIEQALADPGGVLVQPAATIKPRKKLRVGIPWLASAVILSFILGGVVIWKMKAAEPLQVVRFDYELPEGQQFGNISQPPLAVSPDGKQFVYSTLKGLYLRSVDELTAKIIPGTEGITRQPFFSPDGKWIGYFSVTDWQLKKIAISGGAPITLCSVTGLLGASWNEDNTIVYGHLDGIMRISANGGIPESLIKGKSERLLAPQILPGGKYVLYTSAINVTQTKAMVRSLKSGESRELFEGYLARYLPTGHIVYQLPNNNNLFAIPFDIDKLEVKGGQVPIVEAVRQAAISNSGTLVYIPGTATATAVAQRTLVWVDRKGKEEPLAAASNAYAYPRVSPDGTLVALTIGGISNSNIWIWDLFRKTMTRLTFDETIDLSPVWTPDGKRIAFSTIAKGKNSVYQKAADGTGKDELLVSVTDGVLLLSSWSAGGKNLVLEEITGSAGASLYPSFSALLTSRTVSLMAAADTRIGIAVLSTEGDRAKKPLLQGKFYESNPQISPDGRWIAYFSAESGKSEIYVRPFPQVDSGKWQVSTSGGQEPRWSPNGRELFYRNGDAMMAVAINTDPTFKAGTPEMLFRGAYYSLLGHMWDLSPDGKRFLMIKPESAGEASKPEARQRINIVLNWFEELKQRVPVK